MLTPRSCSLLQVSALFACLGRRLEGDVALASVEHIPTLHSQWLRWTFAAIVADDAAEIAERGGAPPASPTPSASSAPTRWAAVADIRQHAEAALIDAFDLARVLDAVMERRKDSAAVLFHVGFSLAPSPRLASCAHLRVSLLLTHGPRVLLLTLPSLALPSTHCDRGETLTFSTQRFARALLGLTQLRPSIVCLAHFTQPTSHALAVDAVFHTAVENASTDAAHTGEWEVDGAEKAGRAMRSYARCGWYGRTQLERARADAKLEEAMWELCDRVLLAVEQGTPVSGVVAQHVQVGQGDDRYPGD